MGLALFLKHPLHKRLEAGLPSKTPGLLWVWLRIWGEEEAPSVVSSAIKEPEGLEVGVCVCVCGICE